MASATDVWPVPSRPRETGGGVTRLLASSALDEEAAGLVSTPHRPLVIGFAARMALRSLAFSANGHFSS